MSEKHLHSPETESLSQAQHELFHPMQRARVRVEGKDWDALVLEMRAKKELYITEGIVEQEAQEHDHQ